MLDEQSQWDYMPGVIYFWYHIVQYHQLLAQQGATDAIRDHELLMLRLYVSEKREYALDLPHELRERMCAQPHNDEFWFEVQNEVGELIWQGPYLRLALDLSSKIHASWRLVLERISIEQAALLFYRYLFTIEPSTRALFGADFLDMTQSQMLLKMIDTCASLFVNIDTLVDFVLELGEQHRRFNLRPEHFESVGNALLQMLRAVLHDSELDEETERAWLMTYEMMSMMLLMTIDPAHSSNLIVGTSTPNPLPTASTGDILDEDDGLWHVQIWSRKRRTCIILFALLFSLAAASLLPSFTRSLLWN
jgi:hemoglobin-like flavoprotein